MSCIRATRNETSHPSSLPRGSLRYSLLLSSIFCAEYNHTERRFKRSISQHRSLIWRLLRERGKSFMLEDLLKIWTGALASGIEGMAGCLIALAALRATIRAIVLFFRRGQRSYQIHEPRTENIRLEL